MQVRSQFYGKPGQDLFERLVKVIIKKRRFLSTNEPFKNFPKRFERIGWYPERMPGYADRVVGSVL